MLQSVSKDQANSSVKRALVYSAIAIGAHLRNTAQGQKDKSESFFRQSLLALTGVLLAKDTLLKLQVSDNFCKQLRSLAYELTVISCNGKLINSGPSLHNKYLT